MEKRLGDSSSDDIEECNCGSHHHHEEESCGCVKHDECTCGCGHHHDHEEDCECGHHHEDECNCENHAHLEYDEACTLEMDINDNKIKYLLKGLNCAGCAAKIEGKVNQIEDISEANLNFSTSTLVVEPKNDMPFKHFNELIEKIVYKIEPDVNVINLNEYVAENGNKEIEQKEEKMINKSKIARITIGAIIFIVSLLIKVPSNVEIPMFLVSYLLIGGDVLFSAIKNIAKGQIFDEKFLMVIATFGAFSIGELSEAVAVMLFYQIGENFQDFAVNRSRKSITDLMDIRPEKANLKVGESIKEVSPEKVKVDDIIVVKPGEKVPLDGEVIEGKSMIDTSALTGESVPRSIEKGNEVLSGSINKNGMLTIKVTKNFSESAVSKILDLVENAGAKKAKTEQFITKFARYYTPIVVISAVLLAVVPPLVIKEAMFSEWFRRALVFLVVSCPCALVVSVPLGFFGGIGCASKNGILVKGGNYLEALNSVDTVVFDKTGTLTKGTFDVTDIKPAKGISEEELLKYAAYSESYSNHPIAKSIIRSFGKKIDKSVIKDYMEVAGNGIKVTIDGKEVLSGNSKLMNKYNIDFNNCEQVGTVVYVSVDKKYIGSILISDTVKLDSKKAIKELKSIGVKNNVMLTGDSKSVGEKVAKELGLDNVYTELLPQDKVTILERLINKSSKNSKTAFVGDGVNDAPVLARADVGIAMGGVGSDAAIEAADVVLMTDEPSKLGVAIKIAKNTRRIVSQNIIFALAVKIIVLVLATIGLGNMWMAVFADVGVALLAVLNSMRVLKTRV